MSFDSLDRDTDSGPSGPRTWSSTVVDERLAGFLANLPDGIVIDRAVRDATGQIVDFEVEFANEAACRLTGMSQDELIGHRILDLFPGRLENGQFEAYVRVVETGEPLIRASLCDHDVRGRSDPEGFGRNYEVSVTRMGDGYDCVLADFEHFRTIGHR